MNRIGVGVIGCGGVSQMAHLPSYLQIPTVRIVAVSDVVAGMAEQVAKKFGAEAWYSDYTKLLKREDVEAVSICTPHETHAQIAIEAAEANKHILCEKPMATSIGDADAMIRKAERNKVILMVGHMKRFDPGFVKMKELLQRSAIGTPHYMKAMHKQWIDRGVLLDFIREVCWGGYVEAEFSKDPQEYSITSQEEIRGLGVLLGQGVHHADLVNWYLGRVHVVNSCLLWPIVQGIERNAVALMGLQKNAKALIEVISSPGGSEPPDWEEKISVYGDLGMIEARGPFTYFENLPTQVTLYTKENPLGVSVSVPKYGRYLTEIKHFIECVTEGKRPFVSGYEGRESLKVIVAAYESARAGKPIHIES